MSGTSEAKKSYFIDDLHHSKLKNNAFTALGIASIWQILDQSVTCVSRPTIQIPLFGATAFFLLKL
tara:strand:+ start:4175 stop:4372 length:198 start_codon:yes stop_codon:yes gene_type:complete